MDNNDTWTTYEQKLTVLGHDKKLFYYGNNIWNLPKTDYATGWDS